MNNPNILVIGSAHIDVLADYDISTKNDINKTGVLQIGIGGVGYNIVTNLGSNGFNAYLYTALKSDSLSAKMIIDSLKSRGIPTDYLFFEDTATESGYVAQRLKGKLETGVTSTLIDIVALIEPNLEKAVLKSEIVVIDCNLSEFQISQVIDLCKAHSKPLFACSVSESKVSRSFIAQRRGGFLYKVFSLSNFEADKYSDWKDAHSKNAVQKICNRFNAENVVITNGKKGFSVFQNTGLRNDYEAVVVPKVVSELGAGDALFSAVVAYYAKHSDFNWDDCAGLIHAFVKPVLASPFSTTYSKAGGDLSSAFEMTITEEIWINDNSAISFWIYATDNIEDQVEVDFMRDLLIWKELYSKSSSRVRCVYPYNNKVYRRCLNYFRVSAVPCLIVSNQNNFERFVKIEGELLLKIKRYGVINFLHKIHASLLSRNDIDGLEKVCDEWGKKVDFQIDQLKELVSSGKVNEAMRSLKGIISRDHSLYNDFLIVSGRIEMLERNYFKGVLGNDEYSSSKNKLLYDMMHIIQCLEK